MRHRSSDIRKHTQRSAHTSCRKGSEGNCRPAGRLPRQGSTRTAHHSRRRRIVFSGRQRSRMTACTPGNRRCDGTFRRIRRPTPSCSSRGPGRRRWPRKRTRHSHRCSWRCTRPADRQAGNGRCSGHTRARGDTSRTGHHNRRNRTPCRSTGACISEYKTCHHTWSRHDTSRTARRNRRNRRCVRRTGARIDRCSGR